MGTLVRGTTVLLRSGTVPYIGDNGHWWIGSQDLGVNAGSPFYLVSQTEFDAASTEGIYYVVTDGAANVWYISDTGTKSQINGEFTPPTIGENGNWFIGGTDTGQPAVAKQVESVVNVPASGWTHNGSVYVQTVAVEGMTTDVRLTYKNPTLAVDVETARQQLTSFDYINRFTPGDGSLTMECFSDCPVVDLELTLGYTDGVLGIFKTGAVIDDNSVNTTTTWSSYQIEQKLKEAGTGTGKGLEFAWDGKYLGVRQQGTLDYKYSDDLSGPRGLTGLDGSAIIDGYIDERGHLILTMQDPEDDMPTHKILSLAESGIITKDMILSIMNSIERLNREVLLVSPAHHEYEVPYVGDTAAYMTVMHKVGHGNCQIVVTDFTGMLKLTVDEDTVYEVMVTDITTMDHFNLLVLDKENNTIKFVPVEDDAYTGENDIIYEDSIKLEVDVDSNEENEFPTFSIKGNHFDRASGDVIEGGGYYEEITDEELEDMLDEFDDGTGEGEGAICPDCGGSSDGTEEIPEEVLDDMLDKFDDGTGENGTYNDECGPDCDCNPDTTEEEYEEIPEAELDQMLDSFFGE